MSLAIWRTTALTAALSLAPYASFAQEVFGTMTASLDGVERTWFLTSQDGESQSFGLSMAVANLQSFSLWGQPSADSVQTTADTLLLSFDVMSVGDQTIPLNMSLMYLENGWQSGWLTDEAERIDFALTTLEKSDAGVLVEGRFETDANYRAPLASGEIDTSRTMQISGIFTATLPPFILTEQ
ncbi:hypothetical protein OO012_15110 [Rhodobacteraceae bacterium KMM 6894]|nr:hypothetical protein [Rhodobacteraceae bacterium KMM 6894]